MRLAFDRFGSGPPVVFLMGIGAQRHLWPLPLLQAVCNAGFEVWRCDNRDTGESEHSTAPPPSLPAALVRSLTGSPVQAPYTLSDMARDVVEMMEANGVSSAHVVGVSMGGMIAQTMAIEHASHVRSLVSIMSTTGSRKQGWPGLGPLLALATQGRANTPEEYRARLLRLQKALGSGRHPPDPARLEALVEKGWSRSVDPSGLKRQFAAVLASGSRGHALSSVTAPTLILHGADDPLFPPSFAHAQAQAIPGARLRLFDGMGHELPAPLWDELAHAIAEHAARAEDARS